MSTHEIDQALAAMRDILSSAPAVLRAFFVDLKKEGFSDAEALELTNKALARMLGGG